MTNKKVELLSNPDYPEGSLLVDCRYFKRTKENPECFEVIIWNSLTKRLEVYYEEPIIDIWFLKEDKRTNKYQISQALIEDCYKVLCKPSQVCKMIAENIGGEYAEYYEMYKDEIYMDEHKKFMLKCPWVFKADFLPDVYYRLQWNWKHGDEGDISKVEVAFLDIEVDVLDKTIDLKNRYDVTQPVNAVTLILPTQKITAIFVLGPRPKYKLHSKFHKLLEQQEKDFKWLCENQNEFIRMVKEDDPDNKKYIGDHDIRLHIFPFEREIDMIKTIFDYINKYRPWFTLSWNAEFDDNYLVNRMSYLGYDPADIMIPPEFITRKKYYQENRDPNVQPENSKDWFFCSTYTQFMCQMKNYALTRKSQQKKRSMKLTDIGRDEAGITKLNVESESSFREAAYINLIKFLLYNVRDVVVQVAIDASTMDAASFYARSYNFCTQYSKCFQETHIVRNSREYYFELDGFVQACALEVDKNADSHYKGAYVADPMLNKPTGLYLNGKNTNNFIIGPADADAKAYYPSSKMGTNQDPMTLKSKCVIPNEQFIDRTIPNKSMNQEYWWYDSDGDAHAEDMACPIFNTYKNGNVNSLCHAWMNAPSLSELFEYIDANL